MVKKIDNRIKINNVKLIINGNKTVEEVAVKLGVSNKAVLHWKKVYISNRKKKRNRVIAGVILLLIIFIPIITVSLSHKKNKSVDETTVTEITENKNNSTANDKNPLYNGIGTVFIDPGHGFTDGGTIPPEEFGLDIKESKIAMDVSNRVAEILKANGYKVTMTRTEDYNEIQETKFYKIDLIDRVKKAEESNADVFVSLHVNAYEESNSVNGYDVFYCDKGEEYNTIANRLGEMISSRFIKNTGIDKIKVNELQKNKSFYVTRKTTMPSVLFEMGYFTNLKDAKRLTNKDFLEKLAKSVAEGIMEFLTELSKEK